MGIDISARALAVRSLERTPQLLQEFGTLSASDGEPARRAFRDAFAAGVSRLAVAPGTYHLAAVPADEAVHMQTPYQQPSVILPAGFRRLDGQGSEFLLYDGRGLRGSSSETWGYPSVMSYLAADVTAGDTTLTLEPGEGAKWSAGDQVIWRFGSIPYDAPEPIEWGMGIVTAVAGDEVTLDRPVPTSFAISSVADKPFVLPSGETWYNKALHKWPLFEDLTITDLIGSAYRHPDGDCWTEQFISIRGGRRIRLSGCGSRRVGIGFTLQYVTAAAIEDCWSEDGATFPGSHSKCINLAETRDVEIRNVSGKGLKMYLFAEADSQARVIGGSFENTGKYDGTGSYGADCIVFSALSRSCVSVRDFTVTGLGGYVLSATDIGVPDYEGSVEFDGSLTLIHPDEPYALQPGQITGLLDYRIAGERELWDFRALRVWRRRIYLRDGLLQNLRGPRGILVRMRVYASPGLTFGDSGKLKGLYVGRESDVGSNVAASLVAGADATIDFLGGLVAGPLWTARNEQLKLLVNAAAAAGLNAADAYLDVECEFAVDRRAGSAAWSADSDARNSGPGEGLREALFTAYDIPSIPANGVITVDFPVAAVLNGDIVEGFDYTGNLASISIRHMESITGAVRVIFANTTAAAYKLPASDIRITWRKSLTSG
ncbi:MAG: hypothetical protein ACTHK5_07125 [Tsuneonella sp.]